MEASMLLMDLCVLKENAAPEGALDHQAAKLSLKKVLPGRCTCHWQHQCTRFRCS